MAEDNILEGYRKRILKETEFVNLEGIPLPSGAKEVPLDKVYIRLHAITERRRETQREDELGKLKVAMRNDPAGSGYDYLVYIQRLGDFIIINLVAGDILPKTGRSILKMP